MPGEPGCSVVPLGPSFALGSWTETGRGKTEDTSERGGERLIVHRVLGLYGHVAGGFVEICCNADSALGPLPLTYCAPVSARKKKGLVSPRSCQMTPAESSVAPEGSSFLPRGREGSGLLPGSTGSKFWVCHPLGDLEVSFKLPCLPALLCNTLL